MVGELSDSRHSTSKELEKSDNTSTLNHFQTVLRRRSSSLPISPPHKLQVQCPSLLVDSSLALLISPHWKLRVQLQSLLIFKSILTHYPFLDVILIGMTMTPMSCSQTHSRWRRKVNKVIKLVNQVSKT